MTNRPSELVFPVLLLAASILGTFVLRFPDLFFGKAILHEDCSANGTGAGRCVFTNTGDAAGSMCGKVEVKPIVGDLTTSSPVVCSGKVAPKTSATVQFFVPDLYQVCKRDNLSWTDNCILTFRKVEGE